MSDLLCEDTLNELIEQVGKELVETLFDDLTQDAGDRVTLMQQLLADGNMDELRKEAHTLKSSTGTLGLKDVSAQAQIIERKLVTGEGPDITPIVPVLPGLLSESLTAATTWLATK